MCCESQKNCCDEPVTLEECTAIVHKHMKLNKCPGLDGLPVEFYQRLWPAIGPFLVEVYQEAFTGGKLSNSQCKAVIALIPKTTDRLSLKNYRPISLTNCDYKILAFVLAQRLQNIMPNVISFDQ